RGVNLPLRGRAILEAGVDVVEGHGTPCEYRRSIGGGRRGGFPAGAAAARHHARPPAPPGGRGGDSTTSRYFPVGGAGAPPPAGGLAEIDFADIVVRDGRAAPANRQRQWLAGDPFGADPVAPSWGDRNAVTPPTRAGPEDAHLRSSWDAVLLFEARV